MKILKHKNITGIILGLLLLMPFLSIFARSAYVVVNKNAYQSYSGTTSQQVAIPMYNTNELQSYDDFVVNNYYVIEWQTQQGSTSQENLLLDDTGIDNFKFISYWASNLTSFEINDNDIFIDFLELITISNNLRVVNFDSTHDYGSYILNNNVSSTITNQILVQCIDITNLNLIANDFSNYFTDDLSNFQNYIVETIESSTLDNVFEYSVSKFVDDNNFGNIDLFSWFFNMFLDTNTTNNLYVNFANWYMNYAMLITLMHFLFMILMWFINYSRRLLDRGINYDW